MGLKGKSIPGAEPGSVKGLGGQGWVETRPRDLVTYRRAIRDSARERILSKYRCDHA